MITSTYTSNKTRTASGPDTGTHSNYRTLESYSRHAGEYFQATISRIDDHNPAMRIWINESLELVPSDGMILEIGSATLRDATYMRDKGYNVVCTEAAQGLIDYLGRLGESAMKLNILTDEIQGTYDMVFANGVFPHFSPQEASLALSKIHRALKPSGIFAVSIKLGGGESFCAEKFNDYCYTFFWDEIAFQQLVTKSYFTTINTTRNKGSFPSHDWLNLVLQKI